MNYKEISERFADMTARGADFGTALHTSTTDAPAELAERFRQDATEYRTLCVDNLCKLYTSQTAEGACGADILASWKQTTPTDIFDDVVKKLSPATPQATTAPTVSTLEEYIRAGIKLIPTRPNQEGNFYQLKKGGELIKIDSLPGLQYWIDHGIERFIFIPKEAGFLCFDLDRNHQDGADGVKNFSAWLADNGLAQIPLFRDLDGGSFPTYTTTASGGLHLYFRCMAELKTVATIAPGVEIKYNGLNITAGGSVKNGRAYTLHGDLRKAPTIPAPLLLKLSKVLRAPPKPTARTYQAKEKRGYTVDQLLNFARQDSEGGGPHDMILQMAGRLKRAGYGEADAMSIIEATPEHQGRNNKQDTISCIQSIYR